MKLLLAGCAAAAVLAALAPSNAREAAYAARNARPTVAATHAQAPEQDVLSASRCATCHSLARPISSAVAEW